MTEIEKLRALLAEAVILALVGCACVEQPKGRWREECDAVMRREVFLSCLEKVPRGPERITVAGNDWDEIVAECSRASYRIACHDVWEKMP